MKILIRFSRSLHVLFKFQYVFNIANLKHLTYICCTVLDSTNMMLFGQDQRLKSFPCNILNEHTSCSFSMFILNTDPI